ncbi:hypothetical protein BC830DRAFT_1203752 [Chytriomyces sp. MP71]|nr:hypothetical protein BC830DRAFT_1203752 [Chytriomyces sp. MP71]
MRDGSIAIDSMQTTDHNLVFTESRGTEIVPHTKGTPKLHSFKDGADRDEPFYEGEIAKECGRNQGIQYSPRMCVPPLKRKAEYTWFQFGIAEEYYQVMLSGRNQHRYWYMGAIQTSVIDQDRAGIMKDINDTKDSKCYPPNMNFDTEYSCQKAMRNGKLRRPCCIWETFGFGVQDGNKDISSLSSSDPALKQFIGRLRLDKAEKNYRGLMLMVMKRMLHFDKN